MTVAIAALLLAGVACSGAGGADGPDAAVAGSVAGFPADYLATFAEVRACRHSSDHELHFIRVLAAPAALGPYQDRATPFPDGAVVLKEEFDLGDTACAGDVVQWTVMVKDAMATARLGWAWQRVLPDRSVVEDNASRCNACHVSCSGPPEIGYDFTCAEPP